MTARNYCYDCYTIVVIVVIIWNGGGECKGNHFPIAASFSYFQDMELLKWIIITTRLYIYSYS